ncbi:LysR family transcriptional regulator [Gluconacetobacter sacchari]|uniref:LysR family transcriptional regulator n=1 Tax=Gluconacetobacter sacchari TaxID=92759 RepID=UPI0039B6627E
MRVSTLSRAVSRLEDKLAVTLVERSPTGIHATASGRQAMRHIRRVLNETNAMKETLE